MITDHRPQTGSTLDYWRMQADRDCDDGRSGCETRESRHRHDCVKMWVGGSTAYIVPGPVLMHGMPAYRGRYPRCFLAISLASLR